jgi:RNA polymerase sigma-70 factor (ECF subfamily)
MDKTDVAGDKKLVAEFLKGKVKAFDLLYEQYSGRLYRFAFMLLKNREDALDIVQETFLRIWKNREDLSEEKSFKSYLFTVSYNITVDLLRKRLNEKKYCEALEKNFGFSQQTIENRAGFMILDHQIREVIEELPPRRREIFKLSRESGRSNKEIAADLDISVKTVETQLNLALKFLKSRLADGSVAGILFLSLFYS